jgi:hypothetical protein
MLTILVLVVGYEFILPSRPAEEGEVYIFDSAASGHLSSLEQIYF